MQSLYLSRSPVDLFMCNVHKFDAKIRLFRHIWFIELIWNGIAPSMAMQMAPQPIQHTNRTLHRWCCCTNYSHTMTRSNDTLLIQYHVNLSNVHRIYYWIVYLFNCAHTHIHPRSFVSLHLIRIWKQSRYEYVAKCVN